MSASDTSEALEPESSDSLDTMLGLSTETGRDTAVTPSFSLGTQALSELTLGSSQSSRPPTPPTVGRGRPPQAPWSGPWAPHNGGPSGPHLASPRGGDTAEQSPAALASGPAPPATQRRAASRCLHKVHGPRRVQRHPAVTPQGLCCRSPVPPLNP